MFSSSVRLLDGGGEVVVTAGLSNLILETPVDASAFDPDLEGEEGSPRAQTSMRLGGVHIQSLKTSLHRFSRSMGVGGCWVDDSG